MLAIRVHEFGGPEVLRLETVTDPVAGKGQVVVRIRAIGVNPVDTYIRSGAYGTRPIPFTPGYDGAGEVESVGPGVSGVRVGDRVVVYRPAAGTYAEKTLCEQREILALPDSFTFEQGASLGVSYFTAYTALFQRGRAKKGETVLVHGATGGVGTACVQLAHAAGLRVFGTGSTEAGRALARQSGAQAMFDHSRPGYTEEIRGALGGIGPELIIEMLANVNLERDLELVGARGRIVIVGSRGKIEITPRLTMRGNLDVLGMSLNNSTAEELLEAWRGIHAGIGSGHVKPVVGEIMRLDQAAAAHERILAPGAIGKLVLIP